MRELLVPHVLQDGHWETFGGLMEEEIRRRADRITEINREIAELMPEFLQAGGNMDAARHDGRIWADRLDPLFEEHHRLAQEINGLLGRG